MEYLDKKCLISPMRLPHWVSREDHENMEGRLEEMEQMSIHPCIQGLSYETICSI